MLSSCRAHAGAYEDERIFPFELEMLEGALMVATGGPGLLLVVSMMTTMCFPRAAEPASRLLWRNCRCCRQACHDARLRGRHAAEPASTPAMPRVPPAPPAAGKLDAELAAATRRVSSMLQKLPREITPVNLEELRRVKQLLVELESKAENMRWVVGGWGWWGPQGGSRAVVV